VVEVVGELDARTLTGGGAQVTEGRLPAIFHLIVKRKARQGFEQLSAGNFEAIVKLFDESGVLRFSGDHAMGGEHRGPDQVRAWFERVHGYFPDLRFDPIDIVVDGPPWNTRVATRFRVSATLPDGRPYENEGMQFLRLRWGRAHEDFLYEDTAKLAGELERMGATR
jgi:ketosteroid isomerase-like protein